MCGLGSHQSPPAFPGQHWVVGGLVSPQWDRRNRVCAFSPSQLMAVVASTILDLIRNMRAFGGILAVSLAACTVPSGERSWTVGEPGLNRRLVAFGRRVPVLGERVTRAQEAQGGAGSQREELRAGLAGGAS